MKLLLKSPEERYQSAHGLAYDLERFCRGEREFLVGEKDQKIKLTYQTKLIGRETEFETIKELYHKAQKGQGSICLVSGEAGMSKSRLIEEFRGYIYERNGLFLKGRCLNHENKAPYQPFKDALDDFWAEWTRMETYSRGQMATRLRNKLGDLGGFVTGFNPRMSVLTGETRSPAKLQPERENQRYLMVLSEFIRGLAGDNQVCVLYLDDLQWSDESSLNLLAEILKKINKANLLIIGAYRDNETGPGHGLTRLRENAAENALPLTQMKLSTLDETRTSELLTSILGKSPGNTAGITRYILKSSLHDEKIIMDSFAAGAVNYIEKNNFREIPSLIRSVHCHTSPVEILLQDYYRLKRMEPAGSFNRRRAGDIRTGGVRHDPKPD
jgi:hypothetical protein